MWTLERYLTSYNSKKSSEWYNTDQDKNALDKIPREEQVSIRQNRTCIDQIAKIRIIIEQSVEWHSSILYLESFWKCKHKWNVNVARHCVLSIKYST